MPVQRRDVRQIIDNQPNLQLGAVVLPGSTQGSFLTSLTDFGLISPKQPTQLITATQVGSFVLGAPDTKELGPLTTTYTGPDVSFDLTTSRFTINTPGTYTVHIRFLITYPVGAVFGGRIVNLNTIAPSAVSRSFVQATQPISGGIYEMQLSASFNVADFERYRIQVKSLDTGLTTTISNGIVAIYKHLV